MNGAVETAARLHRTVIGSLLGESAPREITQSRVSDFAQVTDDNQWIHVDAERAASGPYGGTIAHGYLLLALLPSFTRDVVDFFSQGTVINYGLNRVRFLAAARTGIRCLDRIALSERTEKKTGTLYELQHELIDEAAGDVLCLAQTLTMVLDEAQS